MTPSIEIEATQTKSTCVDWGRSAGDLARDLRAFGAKIEPPKYGYWGAVSSHVRDSAILWQERPQ